MTQAQLQQGPGTPGSPVYIGAEHLAAAPVLVAVTIDPSSQTSIARVKSIQDTLLVTFQAFVFPINRDGGQLSAKLHPWAVIHYVNLFTGHIFSPMGVSNLNLILSTAGNAIVSGPSHPSAERAYLQAGCADISQRERDLFASIARKLDVDTLQHSPYTTFVKMCACVDMTHKVEDLVTDIHGHPDGTAARNMERRRGDSIRSAVMRSCGQRLGLDPLAISRRPNPRSAEAWCSCTGSFTGGFLLFVTPGVLRT